MAKRPDKRRVLIEAKTICELDVKIRTMLGDKPIYNKEITMTKNNTWQMIGLIDE